MDSKNNKKPAGEVISELLSGIAGRIFGNESKGEAAFYLAVLILAAAAFVIDIIAAIFVGRAWGIIYSLTVGAILFLFVPLLTVSDRFFLLRGRSMIIIVYSAISLILVATGFADASGAGVVLAILGIISAAALYGTLIYDQLFENDHPFKYWLIYSGALYRILYSLVFLIIDGVRAVSVVGTLKGIFGALASVSVIILKLYIFDRFSFAKYMYYEIIDAGADEDIDDIIDESAVSAGDIALDIDDGSDSEGGEHQTAAEETPEFDDIPADAEYIPYSYDESEPDSTEPEGNEPEEIEFEESEADSTEPEGDDPEEIEFEESEPDSTEPEGDEPEEMEFEESEPDSTEPEGDGQEAVEPEADEADETEESEPEPEMAEQAKNREGDFERASIAELLEELSPVELKYARFAAAHNKPDQTLQVTGMSGDLFDVWVDNDTLCFLNDLGQALEGRGIRVAVIPFGDVSDIGFDQLSDGAECVVLTYIKSDETREIRFTKESFANFKRVMEEADSE